MDAVLPNGSRLGVLTGRGDSQRKRSPHRALAETAAVTQPRTDASEEGGRGLNTTVDQSSTGMTVRAGYTQWPETKKSNKKYAEKQPSVRCIRNSIDLEETTVIDNSSSDACRQPGDGVTQILCYLKS